MLNVAATPAKIRRPRDAAVEGLRGLAAIVVLYNHVMVASVRGWSPPKWTIWPVDASAAVMIFFVLSGYVIGLTYRDRASAQSVKTYVWRRFVRLMPTNSAAVFLACAFATSADWETTLANLLFLENYTDYAGVRFLILETNPNLWSLNYEVVYYAFFILVWVLRPRLMIVGLFSVIVLLLGWYTRFVPLFVACYAAGFLFWLAGLALAWHAKPAADEHTNWPSCLLLALITWKLQGLRLLLSGFPMPGFPGPVVKLYALDFLPVSIWLLSAVAQQTHPFLASIKFLCAVIPAIAFVGHLIKPGGVASADLQWMTCAYSLALLLWYWRPSLRFFRWLAPVGLISFGMYALSRPFQELIFRHGQFLPANIVGFSICAAMTVFLGVGAAWYLERRVQAALQRFLSRSAPAPSLPEAAR